MSDEKTANDQKAKPPAASESVQKTTSPAEKPTTAAPGTAPGRVKEVPVPAKPTADQVARQIDVDLILGKSARLQYHMLRVDEGLPDLTTFNDPKSLYDNAESRLKMDSGTGSKLFLFVGWRLLHSSPAVTVTFSLPGSPKVISRRLVASKPNEGGDVPDIQIPADLG